MYLQGSNNRGRFRKKLRKSVVCEGSKTRLCGCFFFGILCAGLKKGIEVHVFGV